MTLPPLPEGFVAPAGALLPALLWPQEGRDLRVEHGEVRDDGGHVLRPPPTVGRAGLPSFCCHARDRPVGQAVRTKVPWIPARVSACDLAISGERHFGLDPRTDTRRRGVRRTTLLVRRATPADGGRWDPTAQGHRWSPGQQRTGRGRATAGRRAFKSKSPQGPVPSSPEELFLDLPRRPSAVPALWAHQSDILRAYVEKRAKTADLALELPTGTGKTLPCLLIAEWSRHSLRRRVAYACPTRQLAVRSPPDGLTRQPVAA
jgi:hypothetical protein